MKFPLLLKVLIAIILGCLCSLFFPAWAVSIFATVNSFIGNFLGLFIPLLILGLVSAGIAELGNGAGKLLLLTVAIAYLSTVLAGTFSFYTSKLFFHFSNNAINIASANGDGFAPFFEVNMPPFIDVTTALVISFILGISANFIKGTTLKKVILDFRDVVTLVISKVIVPLLPLYIFGIFLMMSAAGSPFKNVGILLTVVVVIFIMHITVLVCQFLIAGFIVKRNPFKALLTMLPAYLTALGTSSSAATIPVTLAQTKKNGVSNEVADFVIPLCATIHMPCSILKIVACSYVIMLSAGFPVMDSSYFHFIFLAAITMIAAPGVPGGAVMAALGPLASILGFTPEMQGVIIALYIAMDPFGTAGNVTGDCTIAMIVDKVKLWHCKEKKNVNH